MRSTSPERDGQGSTLISRRQILKSGIVVAGSIYFSGCNKTKSSETAGRQSPGYILSRETDELFFEVRAIGYQEISSRRRRRLERIKGFANPLLVFKFPPQHYAETAIKVARLPLTMPENVLSAISLYPSRPSTLVFRAPDRQRIDLNLDELLAWDTFELVLPDLNRVGSPYDLDVPDVDGQPFTRIEMPWGVDLTPLGIYGKSAGGLEAAAVASFLWKHSIEPISSGDWTELWTTALQNSVRPDLPNQFEVLGVRGFQRDSTTGSAEAGNLVVTYSDRPGENIPDWLGYAAVADHDRTTAVRNLDRIEIAASLSRRFKYTGKPEPPSIDPGRIKYVSKFNPPSSEPATCATGPAVPLPEGKSIPVCFEDGRTIPVDQFRLSSRGGWLELDSRWRADPGCGLMGWKHSSSLGRDHHVELVRAGFLFPFGIEAELITLSERAFVKDEQGHFVAVLLQQDFLQIPQPNRVDLGHSESIFRSLSISTKRTPPLDKLLTGAYSDLDFFIPKVDGQPFEFEHVGIDWAGDAHTSKMPMFFVANTTRSTNGLIWEPGYEPGFNPPNRPPCGGSNSIPAGGEGLRVVDREWNKYPFRFAQYGDALVTLAKPLANGDTSQRVEWAEWTRGKVWAIPAIDNVFTRPFLPRTRTMKVRLQGMTQFSGGNTFSLATFRDTRFTTFPLLDPEPNAKPPIYDANIPRDPTDGSSAYLFLLETRDLINDSGPPVADANPQITRQRIRAIYYGTSITPNPIPDSLFESINNEVQFGISASSDSTGGLSVPDTHTSTLTRRFGAVGDASFNARRWTAYDASHKAKLEAARRLDYAGFRLLFRKQLDLEPFEKSRTQADINALVTAANTLMGFAPLTSEVSLLTISDQLALAASPGSMPGLKLGDLFGKDAQLLPGISFMDIFQKIAMRNTSGSENLSIAGPSEPEADPLQWNFRITGIDWIMKIIGNGPGQISFADLLQIAKTEGQSMNTSKPIDFGVEASLQWTNTAFGSKPVSLGFIEFIPIKLKPEGNDRRETRLELEARASMSLGLTGLPASLSDLKIDPGKAQITSRAEFKDFIVSVFDAIQVEFESVAFTMSADGRKDFQTKIRDVQLKGLLEFINQLSKVFGKIGDLGMDMDISLTRVRISQTIRFPPREGKPLFVGTAQIINLAFSWGVMIPLTGRDVLTVSFALSSREKPMIIFVPSWYGGKAHVLLEVTTKGLRLIEVSMEYGALVAAAWGIANGVASLTAGVFYMMERIRDSQGNTTSVKVIFKAFVKAAADLDVAGIIHCSGLYMIALGYDTGTEELKGEAIQSVSVKIGFIRYGYSFSATHSESKQKSQALLAQPDTGGSVRGGPSDDNSVGSDQATANLCPSSIPQGDPAVAVQVFDPNMTKEKRDAFERIIDGYLM